MSEHGFINPDSARLAMLRMHQIRRIKLIIGDIGNHAANIVGKRVHIHGDAMASLLDGLVILATHDTKRDPSGVAVDDVAGHDVRENELAQGIDLVLQFLESVVGSFGHDKSPVCRRVLIIEPCSETHCLCEVAK